MTLHEYLAIPSGVRSYLEIGCREGGSLRLVVVANPSLERVVICDTWGGVYGGTARGSHRHIEDLLASLGYAGQTRFLDGDSTVLIPTLRETFDLILVDGDHSEQGAAIDLSNVRGLLAPGGRILFHDICHPAHLELRGVLNRFVASAGGSVEVHEEAEGFGIVTL